MLPFGQWFSRSGLVPSTNSQSACAFSGASDRLLGSVTTALPIPDSPTPVWLTCARMPGCLPVVLCDLPVSASDNRGLNGSAAQSPTWNLEPTRELAPVCDVIVAEIRCSSHDVGLSMNSGRSTVTFTDRTWVGMPCKI